MHLFYKGIKGGFGKQNGVPRAGKGFERKLRTMGRQVIRGGDEGRGLRKWSIASELKKIEHGKKNSLDAGSRQMVGNRIGRQRTSSLRAPGIWGGERGDRLAVCWGRET